MPLQTSTSSGCAIIPSYKEKESLQWLLRSLNGEEIICVIDGNDGSVGTAGWFDCHINYSPVKRGYGNAVKTGLLLAHSMGYDYATVMDVGGTCDPRYLHVESNADILVRARQFDKLWKRAILSIAAASILSIVTGKIVRDATYGYRTYRLEAIIGLLPYLKSNGHATNLELLGLALKTGKTVEYTAVPYKLDANSQLSRKDIKEALRVSLALMKGEYDCLKQQ